VVGLIVCFLYFYFFVQFMVEWYLDGFK
jgi:hypothetical protein